MTKHYAPTERQLDYIWHLYDEINRYPPKPINRAHASRIIQDALDDKFIRTKEIEYGSVHMIDHTGCHELTRGLSGRWRTK